MINEDIKNDFQKYRFDPQYSDKDFFGLVFLIHKCESRESSFYWGRIDVIIQDRLSLRARFVTMIMMIVLFNFIFTIYIDH